MEKFTLLKGVVAPLDRANVDTDAIIPKQYLKSVRKSKRAKRSSEFKAREAGNAGGIVDAAQQRILKLIFARR